MISQAFPNAFDNSTAIKVRKLFRKHLRASASNGIDAVFWEDAEQFLERLGFAARNPTDALAKTLKCSLENISSGAEAPNLDSLYHQATNIVSAECSVFTRQEMIGGEAWSPFKNWARSLGPDDRVITFNYDLVLEILRERQEDGTTSRFQVLLPGQNSDRHGHDVPVFKLHGSTDWKYEGQSDKKRLVKTDKWPPSNCYQVAIAIPGPGKKDWLENHQDYWNQAMDCLRHSQRICFIGYRIPASDSFARDQLLEAISDNNHDGLRIQTVLGPDTESADSRRLRELLRYATGPKLCSVTPVPLYSQDFLACHALGKTRKNRSSSGE